MLRKVTCPNCWESFAPEATVWISCHPDLLGDPLLGPDESLRFLPSRFNAAGQALDLRGQACHRLACPRCHLTIARGSLEAEPFFVSVIGAPACGKSYFLTSMTWELKRILQRTFALSFVDADTESNTHLNGYQELLFQNPNLGEPVAIPKTPVTGDLYRGVFVDGHVVNRARPLLFGVQPAIPDRGRESAASEALRGYAVCKSVRVDKMWKRSRVHRGQPRDVPGLRMRSEIRSHRLGAYLKCGRRGDERWR